MNVRKIQLVATMVIISGTAAARPASAATHDSFACGFCMDSCPEDLIAFCHGQGCSASGGSCTAAECESDEGFFYDYDISCGAAS